jgi:hypothetical protein
MTEAAALRVVAALTAASGALQTVAPGLVLDQVTRQPDGLSRHLFRTIGMFMVATSGTLDRALRAPDPDPGLLTWTAVQKLASSGLLGLGVARKTFSPRVLPIAAFDFGSGLLCLSFRRRLSR